MRKEVKALIDAIAHETDCIDDLIEVMQEQRIAMSEQNVDYVNDLMNETRDIFFEAQTHDTLRNDWAKKLAASFACEPKASSLAACMDNEEKSIFNGTVDRFTQSIFALKGEMLVLNGLIDQNQKYSAMLLSEVSRLRGDEVLQSGTANFRG